jgi:hypothetical protein
MRASFFVVVGTLACLATAQDSASPQAAAQAAAPVIPPAAHGVYVWPNNWAVQKGDFDKALAVPGVDGVGVHFTWAEISPSLKTYDFTAMDRQLAAARSHHLAVELAIAAGAGVPQWMFTPPPAGLGLQRLDFEMTYHGGTEPCHKVSIPPPWDPGYQEAFADMLAQLSRHLHATGFDRDVAVIKLTGINTLTEELGLPNESPAESGNPNPCVTDSPRIWAAAGYRPSLIARAMGGIAGAYQRNFPNTLVTLPIITLFAFPPIGEDGRPVPRQKAVGINDHLLDVLVTVAARTLAGHMAVQDCFLIDDSPADPRTVGLARTNDIPVAWQTNIWFGKIGKGAACAGKGTGFIQKMQNAVACDEAAFLRMLRNGMYPQGGTGASKNGLFIEVFASDVIAFPGAIKAAHDEWKR